MITMLRKLVIDAHDSISVSEDQLLIFRKYNVLMSNNSTIDASVVAEKSTHLLNVFYFQSTQNSNLHNRKKLVKVNTR